MLVYTLINYTRNVAINAVIPLALLRYQITVQITAPED